MLCSCQTHESVPHSSLPPEIAAPPAWAENAIWYQIFPERFRNGDPANDPTPKDMEGGYPGFVPENWEVTPWTHDWYKPDPYFDEVEGRADIAGDTMKYFGQIARLRRYGGDLQGVLDKIPYMDSLGITAVYFNPLNDAPSLHKYDARHWRHIDRNFGPNPQRDVTIMKAENPADPTTWQWTTADSLFVQVINAFHQRDIRVIMDYSFNHTGTDFWAWKDLVQNQQNSAYKDWYWVKTFDNPSTEENEFAYRGWAGVRDLPEIQETVYPDHGEKLVAFEGDLKDDAVKSHIFSVAQRWLDPNQDGDPSDGVDGFRLDVAVELPLGFWREFRQVVRGINPDAYLVGEVWWEKWPDDLMDPAPFVKGDIFDAVMHYQWYRPTRHFFAAAPNKMAVSEYVRQLKDLHTGIRPESFRVMMNVAASHDSPRLGTSLFNNHTQYKVGTGPGATPPYNIHRPDEATLQTQKMLLIQQYTFMGAPHIWAGDEMGMWGADMDDARKPLIWPDYTFESETTHPLGEDRPTDPVAFNHELFNFYRQLNQLRRDHPVLVKGEMDYTWVDDERGILAYSRYDGEQEIIAVFNTQTVEQEITLPVRFEGAYQELLSGKTVEETAKQIQVELPPRSAWMLSN